MTYQDYVSNKFSSGNVKEENFQRLNAYSEQSISTLINSMIPKWKQINFSQNVVNGISNAVVQQIEFLNKVGLDSMDSGRIRKSESIDGYSITWESKTTVVNGTEVINSAMQCLQDVFASEGMLYRGICR